MRIRVQRILQRMQARFNPPRYLLAILVLGGFLRLAHLMALRFTLWFDNLDLDPAYYDAWAQRIAAGDWLGSHVFCGPVLLVLLGCALWLFGHGCWSSASLNWASVYARSYWCSTEQADWRSGDRPYRSVWVRYLWPSHFQ